MRETEEFKKRVHELQRKYIMPCVEVWLDPVFVKGKGAKLWDSDEKEYIDCFAGVSVVGTGHANEKVASAVKDQVERLFHISTLYYSAPMAELAERLARILPIDPVQFFFCNSGTEANEHALIFAKKATGKFEFIGQQLGFYGRGGVTMGLTGLGGWRAGLGPFYPGVVHAPSYHCYRCPMGKKEGPPKCDYACARHVREILRTSTSRRVAAFIAETELGIGGCIPAPPEYFKVLKEILDEENILLIIDEVQTGFGRTGKMFGFEHYDIKPDFVTMAKSIADGIPIGVVGAKAELVKDYEGPHFSTFGGNPVSCRAAMANLDFIVENNLPKRSSELGGYLLKLLREIEEGSKIIDDVGGMGLMIGMEVVKSKKTKEPASDEMMKFILEECGKEGVIIGRGGIYYNRVRFQPPLVIEKEELEKAVSVFRDVVKKVEEKFL